MKPDDRPGCPGQCVVLRSSNHVFIWKNATANVPRVPVGKVGPGALGIIIMSTCKGSSLVLWSNPLIVGWIYDGFLLPL